MRPWYPEVEWLLGTDPTVAWQTLRDVADEPESEWAPVRSRVAIEGWGARLLAAADPDGQWAGGAFVPAGFTREDWLREGQPWTATSYALTQLYEFGLDPDSEQARALVPLVGANSFWDEGGQPFWEGEVEECINGRTLAAGAYFGVDMSALAARLVGERQPDGGWNCERANGSVASSFDTTIDVLEGLAEFERATGGTPRSRDARRTGEEYLLTRGLFRRSSTGRTIDPGYLELAYPAYWSYDILRGLDYFRAAAVLDRRAPDPRLGEAIEIVREKRRTDGRWASERGFPGQVWFAMDGGVGQPSPWITLRALRVLRWWDGPS